MSVAVKPPRNARTSGRALSAPQYVVGAGQWPARHCGNPDPHPEHIWVEQGVGYACFGRRA